MAQRTWSIRPSVPEDLEDIRSLFGAVFGYTRPLAHDLWKYRDNPAGPAVGFVAVDAGQIVGQYVVLPTWLRLDDEVVLGALSLDTMTHPNYRGQGMFVTLAKACMELAAKSGVEVLYGFPNKNSFPGFIRRLNWDHTGDIPRWVRPLHSAALNDLESARLLTSLPGVKRMAALGFHLLPRGKSSPRGIEIRKGRPSEKDLDSLVMGLRASKGLCRIERSPDWLKWRFDPKSEHAYEWVTAYRRESAQACVIWGVTMECGGVLSDLLGSDPEALEAATSAAVRRAKEKKVAYLTALTNETQAIKALKSCGFIRRKGMPLIVRSLTTRNLGGNIHDHASWRISSADVDTF